MSEKCLKCGDVLESHGLVMLHASRSSRADISMMEDLWESHKCCLERQLAAQAQELDRLRAIHGEVNDWTEAFKSTDPATKLNAMAKRYVAQDDMLIQLRADFNVEQAGNDAQRKENDAQADKLIAQVQELGQLDEARDARGAAVELNTLLHEELDAARADCAAMRTAIDEFLEWENADDNVSQYCGQEVRWMDHTEALAVAMKPDSGQPLLDRAAKLERAIAAMMTGDMVIYGPNLGTYSAHAGEGGDVLAENFPTPAAAALAGLAETEKEQSNA